MLFTFLLLGDDNQQSGQKSNSALSLNLTFSRGTIWLNGLESTLVLPSVKRIRTFGNFGRSPSFSVKNLCAASLSALSVKVRLPRMTGILRIWSWKALLLCLFVSASVLRRVGFLLNAITPAWVVSGLMCIAPMSCRRKPFSSMKFTTPTLLVLSTTNATSIPLLVSQGLGAVRING